MRIFSKPRDVGQRPVTDDQLAETQREVHKLRRMVVELEKRLARVEPTLHCSFCGKTQHEVRKILAGPNVFICDECVDLCRSIIDETSDGLIDPLADAGRPAT